MQRDPRLDPRPGDVILCNYFHEHIRVTERDGDALIADWPDKSSIWSLTEWQHATAFDEVLHVAE